MSKRDFIFQIPAELIISIEAKSQLEAWLIIKQRSPKQLPVLPFNTAKADWFICTPNYEKAKLLGYGS